MAEFAHNNRQYSSTRKSLFLVNLRRYPNNYGEDKKSTQKVQEIDEFIVRCGLHLKVKVYRVGLDIHRV